MKFLCLLASAFVAIAVVGAYSHDRLNGQNSQEIVHKLEKNLYNREQTPQWGHEDIDNYWYNKGLQMKKDVENHHAYYHNQGYGQHQNTYSLKYQNAGYKSDLSSGPVSSEFNSNEEYIQISGNKQNDAAYIVGNISAKKIVTFYSIVEKYINNGQIQNRWSNEPVKVPQVTVPLGNKEYLSMIENKINGLSQGIIKSFKINTQDNNVEIDYHFNKIFVNGTLSNNKGNLGSYQVNMTNTDVCVSTELYKKNLKVVDTINEALDMSMYFGPEWGIDGIATQNAQSTYLRYLKKAIESESYENTFKSLFEYIREESLKEFYLPAEAITSMEVSNNKSGLKVFLTNGRFRNESTSKTNKVSSVTVRPIKTINGFRIQVNFIWAQKPTWESDITATKGELQSTFRNVLFQADQIYATATLENVSQHMGGRQFRVADIGVELKDLTFNIPYDELLSTEVDVNLRQMMETKMAAVLKEQLKHEYQIYQQNPEQYHQFSGSNQNGRVLL